MQVRGVVTSANCGSTYGEGTDRFGGRIPSILSRSRNFPGIKWDVQFQKLAQIANGVEQDGKAHFILRESPF